MSDTRSKLLDAAGDVLRTDGITAVSARVVAARAGVNQALVFYHFGTLTQLVDAASRFAVDAAAERYREAFATVATLSQLLQVGRTLHDSERAAGNVAMMAQLMAGGQHDPALAEAARYAMDRWTREVDTVLERVLAASVLAEVADIQGLARAVCAGFIGLELYDGIDPRGGAAALDALTRLAAVVDAVDDLGPVARRAVNASLRASAKRRTR